MSDGVLVLLLLLWAGVLLPGVLRDWRRSPVATVDSFTEAMRRLGGADGREMVVVVPPSPRERMLARRRVVLVALAGAATVGVAGWALVGGAVAGAVAVLAGSLLVAYLGLLRWTAIREERGRRVVTLPTTGTGEVAAAASPSPVDHVHGSQAEPEPRRTARVGSPLARRLARPAESSVG